MRHLRYGSTVLLTLALAACGHGGAPADEADSAASPAQAGTSAPAQAPAAAPVASAEADAARPLQVGDLDAYVRGMQKEIALRQEASDKAAKAKAAKDQDAELSALFQLSSVEVKNAGAKAAGMDPARYDVVKTAIDRALGNLEMRAAMAGMDGGEQMQKRLGDPFASMDPEVASALKARQAELGKLRSTNLAILMNAQKL